MFANISTTNTINVTNPIRSNVRYSSTENSSFIITVAKIYLFFLKTKYIKTF